MRHRILSIAALFVVATVSSAHAQASKTVKCKDGTTSTATGAGACSGHGGVAPKAASSSKSSKAATGTAKKTEKAAEQTAKKTEKTAEQGAKKTASATNNPGAKVTCTDGTLSKPGRGACSGHGGVKKA
jgi:hypothetical protein